MLAAALALAGCATSGGPATPAQALRALIDAGDLAGADALIARSGPALDVRRALDLSIRAGDVRAVRHYLPSAGADAELDPDGTTPLIRAVLDAPPDARAPIVALLVEAGARPGHRDRYGRDATTYAATRNRGELLALLDAGAGRPPSPRLPAFATWLGPAAALPGGEGASASSAASGSSGSTGPATSSAASAPSVASRASSPPSPSSAGSAAVLRSAAPIDPAAGASRAARSGASARASGPPGSSAARAGAAPPPEPLDAGLLLRGSPWRPEAPPDRAGGELAALRFHGDGTADLLRVGPGDRLDPMPGSYVAWRLDGSRLRVAIVGDAFTAVCAGGVGPPAAAPAGTGPRDAAGARGASASRGATGASVTARRGTEPPSTLALVCEETLRTAPPGAGGWSLDVARTLLLDADPPAPPGAEPSEATLLALAIGRDAATDAGTRVPTRAPPLAVSLRGTPPSLACRPGRGRPRVAPPQPRAFGDWHVLDVRRLESSAPLSGRMCAQTAARDAAMRACRAAAGPAGAAACRHAGGCPAGQASALAAAAGVDAGWVACDPDPATARRKALAACRADLGCDCQLVSIAGHNVNTMPGASCAAPAPAARRR